MGPLRWVARPNGERCPSTGSCQSHWCKPVIPLKATCPTRPLAGSHVPVIFGQNVGRAKGPSPPGNHQIIGKHVKPLSLALSTQELAAPDLADAVFAAMPEEESDLRLSALADVLTLPVALVEALVEVV
jgi:hypothetical protein